MEGYVYLVESSVGFYKIGKSKDPVKRIRRFEVTLPFNVTLLKLIKVSDMAICEKKLHEMFEEYRRGGEWFVLDYTSISLIMQFDKEDDIHGFHELLASGEVGGKHDPFYRFGDEKALQSYIDKDMVHIIN